MKKIFCYMAFFFPLLGMAQSTITLKNAIDITLKNNFDIQIASNNFKINKISNTYGMAGGLPSVNLSASDNQSISRIDQFGSAGNTLSSTVSMGLVLFNGLKIVATKNQLSLLQKQSELLLNNQIQNSIAEVMTKYYDIVRQQEYLKIMKVSLDVSQKKLDIIVEKKNVGMANDGDYLQALIDVNTAKQNFQGQEMVVDQTKTDLLQLMSQKNFYPFEVNDSITIDKSIDLNTVTNYLNQNPQYLSSEEQVKINEQAIRIISALRYPTLRFTGSYGLSQVHSSPGNITNQTSGPTAGLALQIPIFNGNAYKVQKEVAEVNLDNAKLQNESIFNTLNSGAIKTYQSYRSSLDQLDSQKNTIVLSRRLVDLILQKFKLNQATIIDVKTAQSSYESTGYMYVNLNYAGKIAEIELKRLMYQLSN
jgi:outer membrane protein